MFGNCIEGNSLTDIVLMDRSPKMLESLAKHIHASTAISLSSLTLTRIACAGVLLDASGKMKVFENAGVNGTKFIIGKILAFVGKEGT